MAIRIVPNSDSATASPRRVLGAIQPVRENLYDALLAQDCGNDTYITVADIAIGSVTGAGSFSLELGGVQASSKPAEDHELPARQPADSARSATWMTA